MGQLRKFSTQGEITKWIRENESILKTLYFKKDLTARKVAENQNVEFDQRFAKVLARELGKKGLGLGGARLGSGNKKGIKFCGICRARRGTCEHTIEDN